MNTITNVVVDKRRRKFLKILVMGSGTLVMGEVLGSLLFKLLHNSSTKTIATTNSKAFRVVKKEKVLSVYDKSGEEILQIDEGR